MAFAYVPEIPGRVIAVSLEDKSGAAHWYHVGDIVTTDWQFNGNAFFPVPAVVPTPNQEEPSAVQTDTAKQNSDLAAQIIALEAKANRALREYALGRPEALTRLQQYDIDITLLRSKLV